MRIGRARIWDSQGLARIWDLGWSWLGSGVVLAGIWGGSNSEGGGPILREVVQIWSKNDENDENDENDRFRHFMAV